MKLNQRVGRSVNKIFKLSLAFSLFSTLTLPVKAFDLKLNTSQPVLSVNFDEENANDVSGNNNHGTVVGDVEYVEGIEGKAIHIQNGDVAFTSNTAKQYVNFNSLLFCCFKFFYN